MTIPGKPGSWNVLEPYVRATKIINVPVAKQNPLAGVTAGMKNGFGLIKGDRQPLHTGAAESIVGLATLMRPTLTIVDATRVLMQTVHQVGTSGM